MSGGCLIGIVLAATIGSGADRPATPAPEEFGSYQVIIDRAPFGAVAGAAAGTAQPGFADRFAFSGLVPSLIGTQVLAVVQDHERNRAELRAEGEMIGDVKVVKIEVLPIPKLVLQRGVEVATLSYQPRNANPTAPPGLSSPTPFPPPAFGAGTPVVPPGGAIRRRLPYRPGGQ